jgi:hypothetical protein
MLYHFECSVCGYDDEEAQRLVEDDERFCWRCFGDSLHFHRLRRWKAIEGLTRLEAKEVHLENVGA